MTTKEQKKKTRKKIFKKPMQDLDKKISCLPGFNGISTLSRCIINSYVGPNVPFTDEYLHDHIYNCMTHHTYKLILKILWLARIRYTLEYPHHPKMTQHQIKRKHFLWAFIFQIFKHHFFSWNHSQYKIDNNFIAELTKKFIHGTARFGEQFTNKKLYGLKDWLEKWIDKLYIKRNKGQFKDSYNKTIAGFEDNTSLIQFLQVDDTELFFRAFVTTRQDYYNYQSRLSINSATGIKNMFFTKKIFTYYELPLRYKLFFNHLFNIDFSVKNIIPLKDEEHEDRYRKV